MTVWSAHRAIVLAAEKVDFGPKRTLIQFSHMSGIKGEAGQAAPRRPTSDC
jgi:hypothetical protein